MTPLLERLLDLDTLTWGDENVAFSFATPMPMWAWIGLVMAILSFSFWSYSRLHGGAGARIPLALVRAMLLTVVLMLLAQPQLVERTEHTEKDWVVVLVDRSASMRLPDVGDPPSRMTRDEQLRDALANSSEMWDSLGDDRVVLWLGFDQYTREIDRTQDGPELGEPSGTQTNLAGALEEAIQRTLARPLAGIVVLSDGRSVDAPSRGVVRRLQSEIVPVHVFPLGSDISIDDLAIEEVVVPQSAFADDITPVGVRISRTLADTQQAVTVRLLDASSGDVLAQREVLLDAGQSEASVTLVHQASDPGTLEMLTEVLSDGEDLVATNNSKAVSVSIVDRPLRVLFIDGYPRWEQRYVKNLLLREASIRSSNILLAPDRRFLQDSDEQLLSLPVSPEEWARFDVVVIGDVSPDVFSREQLLSLREHVATRGGGLVWIGGPGATPSAWRDTSLADLIPFVSTPQSVTDNPSSVTLSPTQSAQDLGVLRLGDVLDPWPEELSNPATGWSVLRWSQRIEPGALKPASVPLAMAHDTLTEDMWPVVISMRYGSGRVVYVGTDEIWRWRYGQGEVLPERFWLQIIRMVGRESLATDGDRAILEVAPSRVTVRQPVRLKLTLLDQSLISSAPDSVVVRVSPDDDDSDVVPIRVELRPESRQGSVYVGMWTPATPGTWIAAPIELPIPSELVAEAIDVVHPNSEFRDPRTDHDGLARLSQETGGSVLTNETIRALPDLLPNRKQRLIKEASEPLWDTPLALLVVLTLLTIEWIGRRMVRLI
ncbi:MAG: hypothetical protein ACYTF7_03015 [Planctomycetota bacterium]|jgi:hypothetical protein